MTDSPIINPFNRLLLVMLALVVVAGFFLVPLDSALPIHWGIDGQPDSFAPAPVALLLPGIVGIIAFGAMVFSRRFRQGRDYEAGRHAIDAATSFVLMLAIVLSGATIAMARGAEIDMPRLVVFLVGAMLVVLGNYLPKTQPNAIAGVRLPWTLNDPANWSVTNRWTGRLMMLGGAAAVLAAILNAPPAVLFAVVLAAALVPVIAGLAISVRLANQKR